MVVSGRNSRAVGAMLLVLFTACIQCPLQLEARREAAVKGSSAGGESRDRRDLCETMG